MEMLIKEDISKLFMITAKDGWDIAIEVEELHMKYDIPLDAIRVKPTRSKDSTNDIVYEIYILIDRVKRGE